MFFLRNKAMNCVNVILKHKRFFSNCNNECNLDIETKQKIQMMFVLTPSLYVISVCNLALTIALAFK